MIGFVLLFAAIWIALTLFEPVIWWLDAGKACDQKYAFDRWDRDRRWKTIHEQHDLSPISKEPKVNSKQRRKLRRKAAREAAKAAKGGAIVNKKLDL